MKFKDYEYIRPNYEEIKAKVNQLLVGFNEAKTVEEAKNYLNVFFDIGQKIETMANIAYIRFSINVEDEFYKQEDEFWNEYNPLFQELDNDIAKAILNSKLLDQLKEHYPKVYFMKLENQQKQFSKEILPLLQEENRLMSRYDSLIASAKFEFNNETLTLPQISSYTQNLDRSIRKQAYEIMSDFFVKNEDQFDDIYDQLVKVRTEMAHKLGYKNFTELGYIRMQRYDYNEEMVKVYREEIVKYVVPLVQKLRDRQAKRLGLEHLSYYDLPLEFLNGNADPVLSSDDILKQGKQMYHELSKETAEFIDFMFNHDLFDVLSKPGKRQGGYCSYIPGYRSPFIFANFNGTSGDVDVLTHEAGHAFQVYSSRDVTPSELIWPTYESAEIHSMSMEFITWPWMDKFFGEGVDKYKFSHLSSGILFLPYGVCVDHFQHEVYNNPQMSAKERKDTWVKLQQLYLPDRDFSENDYYARGNLWVRQLHIFVSPFYYIDYTLAQICAFQFWKRTQVDKDPTAWNDYLNICKLGGTKLFLEIVKTANLKSPFEKGALQETISSIETYLDKVDDSSF